jgi:ribA/ribD-fused uncharacterized protein
MTIITSFTGDYNFLSNFYPCELEMDGRRYPSVEHAFQAAKSADPAERARIAAAPNAGEAKNLGHALALRSDWEQVKVDIMRDLVRQKFSCDPDLTERLLATGDAELIEGNTWRDAFWGVYEGRGENWLGRILMEVRRDLAAPPV